MKDSSWSPLRYLWCFGRKANYCALGGIKVEKVNLIFEYYKEQRVSAQRFDNQRTAITNFMILISGALLAFVINKPDSPYEIHAAFFLIAMGFFGSLFIKKLNERAEYNYSRARVCLEQIDEMVDSSVFADIIEKGLSMHSMQYKVFMRFKLHQIWIIPHIFIMFLGVGLVIQMS